jgi:ribosomal protein L16 Arg81 hydroxylase
LDFAALVAPLPEEEFLRRFERADCFVVRGAPDKFTHLVTLDEIEARLNEGCNLNVPVEVIRGGEREALVDERVPWSRIAVRKREVLEALRARHSFLMRNMSQLNPRVATLIDAVEARFRHLDVRADLHLYVSPAEEATGYNAHRDRPQHKIFLQVLGATSWQVFRPRQPLPEDLVAVDEAHEAELLEPFADFELGPGDLFYMPPGVFHKVRSLGGPRVSFSIPFHAVEPGRARVDRTHIPFRAIFEEGLRTADGAPERGAS